MEKCQAPPVIENGQIEAVSYKCNDGFFLTGSSKLYCSEDGTFVQDPPKCLGKLVKMPLKRKNLFVFTCEVYFCGVVNKMCSDLYNSFTYTLFFCFPFLIQTGVQHLKFHMQLESVENHHPTNWQTL